jgi:hypothetical protein
LSAPQQQALATYSALLESIQMLALDPAPKVLSVVKLGERKHLALAYVYDCMHKRVLYAF